MGRPNVVQVSLPPEVLAELTSQASSSGLTPSTLARAILIQHFQQTPKKERKRHGQ